MIAATVASVAAAIGSSWKGAVARQSEVFEVRHTDAEWRKLLTPQQFEVLRKDGTERAFTSPLLKEARRGTFACAGCGLDLFLSSTKYDSHTGWPSFWAPIETSIGSVKDSTLGMIRTAVHCRRCGGHQGHVFDDGPKPTGLRYCINGVALSFKPATYVAPLMDTAESEPWF